MARIRTIKPEFFRHEGLQEIAATHGAHVMLVFAGLWGHCDRAGRFEVRPRQLKLDILPFIDFDMTATLSLLEAAGFIETYEVEGKRYGSIASFQEHQRISGREASEPAKYPDPPRKHQGSTGEASGKHSGSTGEALGKHLGKQEGKGREEEGKGKGESARARWPSDAVVPETWIELARGQRRALGLADMDLALAARMFGNFYAADVNARSRAEWQAKWINWALKEQPNASRPRSGSTTGDTLRELARMVGECEGDTDRDGFGG